jgi:hypothetical protein
VRSRFTLALLVAGALALVPVALIARDADAKAAYESHYSYAQTWNATLRLVVVDMAYKVTEKDNGSGYILFEYKSVESGGKVSPGSIELIRAADGDPIHVIAQLPAMPRYHEQVLLDALAKKLRDEYGEPIVIKHRAPVEDAGASDDAEP